jgi:hypothetical protein
MLHILFYFFVAQKRCIRAMSGERCWPGPILFCSARLCLRNLICNLCFQFQFICSKVASFLGIFQCTLKITKMFMLITAYNTRQRDDLYVSSHNLSLSKSNPHVCMANLYNMFPVSLKNEQSFKLYLKKPKAFVYGHKFYDFAEFETFVAKEF